MGPNVGLNTSVWVPSGRTASQGVSGFVGGWISEAWLVQMMTGRSLKGTEPRNQLPNTETVMNMTDMSKLNIAPPVRLTPPQ